MAFYISTILFFCCLFYILVKNFAAEHDYVSWDEINNQCIPEICKGSKLTDIIGFDKKISADLLNLITIYDAKALETALKNKRILFLGDLTLKESFNDIIYILSGLNNNVTLRHEYTERMVTPDHSIKYKSQRIHLRGYPKIFVENIGKDGYAYRNTTAHLSELNTVLRYRYLGGGANMAGTKGGVVSLNEPEMSQELSCLFGTSQSSNCPKPDIMVIQSAHQDINHWELSAVALNQAISRLVQARKSGVQTYWKSSMGASTESQASILEYLNLVAKYECKLQGLRFIDAAMAATLFDKYHNSSLLLPASERGVSRNFTHAGLARHTAHLDATYDSWMTQYILNYILE